MTARIIGILDVQCAYYKMFNDKYTERGTTASTNLQVSRRLILVSALYYYQTKYEWVSRQMRASSYTISLMVLILQLTF